MGTLSVFLIFVLLILSSSSEINCFPNYNCACKQHERKTLIDFKNSFSFVPVTPGSNPLSSWVGEDCCRNWDGVGCDNVTCNVVALNIESSDLRSKVVSPALFKLKHLRNLTLELIDFSGSRFPESIGSFKNLRQLDLSLCNFSGPIPRQLNNLTNLLHLRLYYFVQHGPIVDNLNWIVGLRKLQYLDLAGIDLSQTPYVSLQVFHQSPSLNWLACRECKLSNAHFSQFLSNSSFLSKGTLRSVDFSYNNLHGPIPHALTNLSSLNHLSLYNNFFSSSIPLFITTFYSLKMLFINDNRLNGNLPSLLGRLQSLECLDLSNNNFSGVIHEGVFANLSNLNDLSLGSNSLVLESSHDIAGNPSFPKWLLSKKFTSLDLSYCSISLPLPPVDDIGSSLDTLNLANNKINGSLWTLPSSLTTLNLANNDIGVQLPKSLCNCPNLEVLSLQNNTISGTIPSCLSNLSYLKVLDLSSNTLSGNIPRTFGKIFKLNILDFSNNSLQGELPKLNTSARLEVMDLSENQLSGIIPQWTRENLDYLWILRLRSNNLVGSIPLQICSLNESLQILDLADNHLMGVIPQCIGNLGAMKKSSTLSTDPTIRFYGSLTIFEETIKGIVLRYGGNLRCLVSLDLSCNNMVGPIPPNLTNLEALKSLNLSHNYLRGSIPSKIGQLRSLESLDLSENHLQGSIPQSMSALYSLEVLDLSNNNLSGPVPTGYQLQTLNYPANYVGNPNLCADFLPRKCTTHNHEKKPNHDQEKEHKDDAKHEEMWLYVFILLGVATGFWGVIGILIVKKQWRYCYFQLADHIGDWLSVWTALMVTRLMRKIK